MDEHGDGSGGSSTPFEPLRDRRVDTIRVPSQHIQLAIERNADPSTPRKTEFCLTTVNVTTDGSEVVMNLELGAVNSTTFRERGIHWIGGRAFISPVFFIDTDVVTKIPKAGERGEFVNTVVISGRRVDVEYLNENNRDRLREMVAYTRAAKGLTPATSE